MQDKKKKTKKESKVRDLKPKKDAKGGIIGVLGPDAHGPGVKRPGNPNT